MDDNFRPYYDAAMKQGRYGRAGRILAHARKVERLRAAMAECSVPTTLRLAVEAAVQGRQVNRLREF